MINLMRELSRCGGGWSLFTDDEGDLYALGNAWFGFAHFFDRDPSKPYRITDSRAVLSLIMVGDLWSIGRIR